jgi:hypothetical protein
VVKTSARKKTNVHNTNLLRHGAITQHRKNQILVDDGRTYLLVFKSLKAEAEGNYAMAGIGLMQGVKIGNNHVSVVKGYQVRELERLKIPYQIFTTQSNGNGNHKSTTLRK